MSAGKRIGVFKRVVRNVYFCHRKPIQILSLDNCSENNRDRRGARVTKLEYEELAGDLTAAPRLSCVIVCAEACQSEGA